MSLYDKNRYAWDLPNVKVLPTKDVKAFIKELMEKIKDGHSYESIKGSIFLKEEIIKEVFGKGLVDNSGDYEFGQAKALCGESQ